MSTIKARKPQRKNAKKQESNSNLPLLIGAGVLVVFVVGLFLISLSTPTTTSETAVASAPVQGATAPNFNLTALSGEDMALSDYEGDVVIVNLWATWCPPCRAEMPGINEYYKAHQADGVTVLAVNAKEDFNTVQTFIQAQDFSFPILLDVDGLVIDKYQVRSFPTTFIIDREGVIRYTHTGAITPEQLEAVIAPLL